MLREDFIPTRICYLWTLMYVFPVSIVIISLSCANFRVHCGGLTQACDENFSLYFPERQFAI